MLADDNYILWVHREFESFFFFAMLKVDLLILNCSVIVVAMEKLPPLALHMQVKEETIRTNFPALSNWLPDFSLALVIIKLV
jgi:hypothetical protein